MSSKVVRDAVEAHIRTNWLASDAAIAGEINSIDEPPANLDPWLSFDFDAYAETEMSLGDPGNNCHREEGICSINVWIASGSGPDVALTLAEKARVMMRHKSLGNGVRTTTASPPETGIPSQTNSSRGNFFAFQTSVNYIYDYIP